MADRPEMAWRSTRNAEWIERHCHVPEGMLVGQPLKLHPVQLEILAGIYDSPTRQAIITFGKKNGKGLALDTPIRTTGGRKTMAAVRVGDHVFGTDGSPTRVMFASETNTGLRCWRLRFSDGSEVVADEHHQWITRHRYRLWDRPRVNGSGNGERAVVGVVTTPQIAATLHVGKSIETNHKIVGPRSRVISVVGCEEIASVPTKCIQVDASDSVYLCGLGCIPTHNTTLSSTLTLLHLAGPESRENSQMYSLGESRAQAAVLHGLGAKIVRMSPELSAYVTPKDTAKQLCCPERGTLYEALSAEASTAHGKSPAFLIHDELGQVTGPRSSLYSALELSMGAHEDPLSIIISTQAQSDLDLLSILIDDAEKDDDPRTKLFMWVAPEDCDPWDEESWRLANPMYGVTLNPQSVIDQAKKARRMPSSEADFRNYVLNQRVETSSPMITQAIWKACAGDPDPEAFATQPINAGLDLSARNDLTALAYIAQDDERIYHAACEFFAPAVGVVERSQRDRAPYDIWAKDGLITLTPGGSVDYEVPAARVIELCEGGNVVSVAFDRWRMDVFIKEIARLLGIEVTADDMAERVLEVVPLRPHGQGFRDMAPALDLLEGALNNEQIRHGGNPVLTWCAANAVATRDPAGNRKLDKIKAKGRIDGIQALAMAFGGSGMIIERTRSPSVYVSRGLVEVGL